MDDPPRSWLIGQIKEGFFIREFLLDGKPSSILAVSDRGEFLSRSFLLDGKPSSITAMSDQGGFCSRESCANQETLLVLDHVRLGWVFIGSRQCFPILWQYFGHVRSGRVFMLGVIIRWETLPNILTCQIKEASHSWELCLNVS